MVPALKLLTTLPDTRVESVDVAESDNVPTILLEAAGGAATLAVYRLYCCNESETVIWSEFRGLGAKTGLVGAGWLNSLVIIMKIVFSLSKSIVCDEDV